MIRNGFTLVELIFSIVIIAIVFTVVPKLLFVTTKTMEFSIKEDGLFSGIALMGNIIRLPWDENTVLSQGKILDTAANTCDDYRIGGFAGSRNCLNSNAAATPKASFGSTGTYGDVDDYDGYSAATSNGRVQYNLDVEVNYVKASDLSAGLDPDEVKEVKVSVSSSGKTNLCSSFSYYSTNLGHIQINKRAW
jgi:prepilin-type N-terminal cleavage/methylation domain-containing protein